MNKEYVLGLLRNAWNNYVVSCLAGFLLGNRDFDSIPNNMELENLANPDAKVILHLEQMKVLLHSEEKTKKLLNEYMKSALRSFIKDSFESVKLYAKETKQFSMLKKANWYEFSRVIRNNLAHDFMFRFNDRDKNLLPVRWRDVEITIGLDDQPLPVQVMNEANAILLFNDIFQFAETELD